MLLAHNKHLLKLKGMTFDALGKTKSGQYAENVVIAIPTPHHDGLSLITIKRLENNNESLSLNDLTIFSPFGKVEGYPNFIVENSRESHFPLTDFTSHIRNKMPRLSNDTLQLKELLKSLSEKKQESAIETKKSVKSIYSELGRRLSAALSPFAFTLLGLSFGLSTSRIKKSSALFFPILLAALYLVSFFSAKALDSKPLLAISLYLFPEFLIVIASLYKIKRMAHGH